jgi:hypothetical protein
VSGNNKKNTTVFLFLHTLAPDRFIHPQVLDVDSWVHVVVAAVPPVYDACIDNPFHEDVNVHSVVQAWILHVPDVPIETLKHLLLELRENVHCCCLGCLASFCCVYIRDDKIYKKG